MRILIVKLSSIGDVVHALPVLAAIKRAWPEATVSWVVESRAAEILRDNPMLDRLIEIDTKSLRRLSAWSVVSAWIAAQDTLRDQLSQLRASRFDVAIDFQGLLKSALVARLSGAQQRVGFSRQVLREPLSRWLLTKTVEVPLHAHVIRRNLELAAGALGIQVPEAGEDFEFPIGFCPEHGREAEQVIDHAEVGDTGFAILNPGGGWPTKLWSTESFGALADALWQRQGLRSIVTYGPGEAALAEQVTKASRAGAATAASLSLKGFYALARQAAVYVGGDTGPTHLAVAAGAPVVGLFGPTEWWRNGSPRSEDMVIERTDINCRTNCHRRACGHWVCMEIDVEPVFEAASERLRRAREGKNSAQRWAVQSYA